MKAPLAILLLALACAPALAQSTTDLIVEARDQVGAPVPGVHVTLTTPGGLQLGRQLTNGTGQARFNSTPLGATVAEVESSPGATDAAKGGPFLWFHASVAAAAGTSSASPLPLRRNLPYATGVQLLDGANATLRSLGPQDELRVRIHVRVPDVNASATVGARIEVREAANLSRLLYTQTHPPGALANTTLRFDLRVPAANASTFSSSTAALVVRVEIFGRVAGENRTFDRPADQALPVGEACSATDRSVAVDLGAATVKLCVRASQVGNFTLLARQASDLHAQRVSWKARIAANASLPADRILAEWSAYEDSTKALAANVTAGLDRARTDGEGRPRWQDLTEVATRLDAAHDAVRTEARKALATHHDAAVDQAWADRWGIVALAGGGALGGAGLGAGAAAAVVARWRRQYEYWTGYSAAAEPPSPWKTLTLIAAGVGAALLITGLALGGAALVGAFGGA